MFSASGNRRADKSVLHVPVDQMSSSWIPFKFKYFDQGKPKYVAQEWFDSEGMSANFIKKNIGMVLQLYE